jgi:hypothetical protein
MASTLCYIEIVPKPDLSWKLLKYADYMALAKIHRRLISKSKAWNMYFSKVFQEVLTYLILFFVYFLF